MMNCDFCHSTHLDIAYEVPDSALGVNVLVCRGCGLVQSEASLLKVSERIVSTSSGPGWGNVRHAKGLRFRKHADILKRYFDEERPAKILDVGSNRGDFIRWARMQAGKAGIFAVEPDGSVIGDSTKEATNFHVSRVEDVDLPFDHFDFVYCSHTLEHVESASAVLGQISLAMKWGSLLFLEVPNIAYIGMADVVEEWFIDKHTFHFDPHVLFGFLSYLGFRFQWSSALRAADDFHISSVWRKVAADAQVWSGDFQKFMREKEDMIRSHGAEPPPDNFKMIRSYAARLAENRLRVANIAASLNRMAERQRVAFWGAGRLLDALVRGGLDLGKVVCVVDEYLCTVVDNIQGKVAVHGPEVLKIAEPQVVFVLARSSAAEIVAKVRAHGVKNAVTWAELFGQAVLV